MSRLSAVLGIFAIAVILGILGLAYTAVKWLLIVAAVLFALGALRAFVSSRDDENPRGGRDAR